MIWEVCKPFPSVLGLQEWAKFAFFVIFCASGLVSGSQSDLQLAPFGSPCSWAPAPCSWAPNVFQGFLVAQLPLLICVFWCCFFFCLVLLFFCFELFLTLWSCVGFSVSFLFSAVNVIFFLIISIFWCVFVLVCFVFCLCCGIFCYQWCGCLF